MAVSGVKILARLVANVVNSCMPKDEIESFRKGVQGFLEVLENISDYPEDYDLIREEVGFEDGDVPVLIEFLKTILKELVGGGE